MSFKPMFLTYGDSKWYGNAQRFATREEAEGSAYDRWTRWAMAKDWRADESDDPVNYRRVNGADVMIMIAEDK